MRINVTGNAGSGKSSLARRLGFELGLPFFSLDSVVWQPGWVKTPPEQRALAEQGLVAPPSWIFFSAGACHILAGVFLQAHSGSEFASYLLQPACGFRGGHVFVIGDELTFDWLGYQPRGDRLTCFEQERRTAMPGWHGSMVPIADPLSWTFCRQFHYRHPTQFPYDVMERARRFRLELEKVYCQLQADDTIVRPTPPN